MGDKNGFLVLNIDPRFILDVELGVTKGVDFKGFEKEDVVRGSVKKVFDDNLATGNVDVLVFALVVKDDRLEDLLSDFGGRLMEGVSEEINFADECECSGPENVFVENDDFGIEDEKGM